MMRIRISLAFFDFDLYPDPTFNSDADPAPHQRDADLGPLVYRPSTNPGTRFRPESLYSKLPQLLSFDLDSAPAFNFETDPDLIALL
jgi:hypothetical protein